MKAQPLKKATYDKAKELGIEHITLHFSGGNDEGYLDIELEPSPNDSTFYNEVEEWAWEAYDYNGAGDGFDYGDDITYDLKNGRVYTSEWFTARQEGDTENEELKLEEEGE